MTEYKKFVNLDDEPGVTCIGRLSSIDDELYLKNLFNKDKILEDIKKLLNIKYYTHISSDLVTVLTDIFCRYLIKDLDATFFNLIKDNSIIFDGEMHEYEVSLFDQLYGTWLRPGFFKELINVKCITNPNIGRGELLLGLFTTLGNSTSYGDLMVIDSLYTAVPDPFIIEVKGPIGRCADQECCNTALKAQQRLNEWLKTHNHALRTLKPTIGKNVILELYHIFRSNLTKSTDELIELLFTFLQYDISDVTPELKDNIIKLAIACDGDSFISLIGALHLYAYIKHKNFTFLGFIFFDSTYDSFRYLKLPYSVTFEHVFKVYSENLINKGSWGNQSIDKSFKIILKKDNGR